MDAHRRWLAVGVAALLSAAAGCVGFTGEQPAPVRPGPGGGGGGGVPETACTHDGDCDEEAGERCVLAPDHVCSEAGCVAVLRCGPPGGAGAGLLPCTADGDCASASCVAGGGCRRFCGSAEDCPAGFDCSNLPLENGDFAPFCIGSGPDPLRTLCVLDAEAPCPADRHCALRLGVPDPSGEADRSAAVCVRDDGPERVETLGICHTDKTIDGCWGGWCRDCINNQACERGPRCTGPCRTTADCPFPESCVAATEAEFGTQEPAALRYCSLASACFDQEDCLDAGSECRVHPNAVGDLVASCAPVEGRQQLGSPCARDEDCGSGLCLSLPGGSTCTSPCRPSGIGEELGPFCGQPPAQSSGCTCGDPRLPGTSCSLLRPDPGGSAARAIFACQP